MNFLKPKNMLQQLTRKFSRALPHDGVFVRIAMSKLTPSEEFGHCDPGVGVFAIRDIKAGAYIFGAYGDKILEVERKSLEHLLPVIKKLYQDFCILKGDKYICPINFNKLTPCSYLNSSDEPNVICDEALHFRALRDIKAGEELTVRYKDYSENETRPLV